MTLAQIAKWIAGGVLAVSAIPAVSFARSHRPVQAAPPSLMAVATGNQPVRTASTHVRHHKLTASHKKASKLVSHRSSRRSLSQRTLKSSKLHAGSKRHVKLSTSLRRHRTA
jgi:hypothetical protein